jgi:acyl-coenzyme A thioesterase PaaI-like protein
MEETRDNQLNRAMLEVQRQSHLLAGQMRRIIARLAVVRPPADELARAAQVASQFADRLDRLPERTRSWEVSEAGLMPRDFIAYSPVSGRSNALAPPVQLRVVDGPGTNIEGEVTFGPAYEGPPGHVHGGLLAAMFDEMLGFAQLAPGFTATLTVNYRRPTPLNRKLDLAAGVVSVDGRKRIVRGTCSLDGVLTAEAEGLFIAPRGNDDYLARLGLTK